MSPPTPGLDIDIDGSHAYTHTLRLITGSAGDDRLRTGTGDGQMVGSVRLEGLDGDDLLEVGHGVESMTRQ